MLAGGRKAKLTKIVSHGTGSIEMSNKYKASQFAPQNGGIVDCQLPNTSLLGYFAGVPTASIGGYHPGAVAVDITNAAWYKNTGTAAAATWLRQDLPLDLSGLTATAAEINQAASLAASTEVVTTTNIITASENNKTFYLSLAGGFTSTLPAPFLGGKFTFIVKTAPTTAYVITTTSGADIIFGKFWERAGGAGVAGAAQDTQNFVANQAIVSDWAEYRSDGTNWYVKGAVNVAAGVTFAVT